MKPDVAVVIMAKVPRSGRTKTRLTGALRPEEASDLYAAMLRDRCAWLRAMPGVVRAIAFAEWDGDGPPPDLVPEGFDAVPQPPGDLGAGLAAAAAHYLDRGLWVVLVDSDSPTLPLSLLEDAVRQLRRGEADCVVGPSDDGGYCLLGLRRRCPGLFTEMPWSTEGVVPTTIERAAAAGLRVSVLPEWWDVDTPADLDRLERTLHQAWWPSHTAEWLRSRRLGRAPIDPAAIVEPSEQWRAPWERLSSRAVYATPWLRIREDRVRMPNGRETTYSLVDAGRCVGVLPFAGSDRVVLVRQYRYIAGRVSWEMPTGGVAPGETLAEAARRELAEEAGVVAERLDPICTYHTSKSVMDETAHLFIARGLSPAPAHADETEFLAGETIPFTRALAMVASGEITDSMTIIALQHAALTGVATVDPAQREPPHGELRSRT